MPRYNLIYTSPNSDPYLWNGSSLDKLEKKGQEALRFSGKDFKDEELAQAITDCQAAVKEMFPKDENPVIEPVEIKVSD